MRYDYPSTIKDVIQKTGFIKRLGDIFTIKKTDVLISKFIVVQNSTCFGQFLCPSSGVFHCTFGTGKCYTGVTTACVQDQD